MRRQNPLGASWFLDWIIIRFGFQGYSRPRLRDGPMGFAERHQRRAGPGNASPAMLICAGDRLSGRVAGKAGPRKSPRYLNSQSRHNAALDCRRHTTKRPDESATARWGTLRGNQRACRFAGLYLLTNHHRQIGILRLPSSCSFSPSSDRWARSLCEA